MQSPIFIVTFFFRGSGCHPTLQLEKEDKCPSCKSRGAVMQLSLDHFRCLPRVPMYLRWLYRFPYGFCVWFECQSLEPSNIAYFWRNHLSDNTFLCHNISACRWQRHYRNPTILSMCCQNKSIGFRFPPKSQYCEGMNKIQDQLIIRH